MNSIDEDSFLIPYREFNKVPHSDKNIYGDEPLNKLPLFDTWDKDFNYIKFYNRVSKNFIKNNLEWEHTRFVASMIHNVNCSKKSQMVKPENRIQLPQDKVKKLKPKTTKEEFESYAKLVNSKLNKK